MKVEKNFVENEVMNELNIDDFINERIKENKALFTKEELEIIKNNIKLTNKIYLFGILDGKF